jgi:hypothetical protein
MEAEHPTSGSTAVTPRNKRRHAAQKHDGAYKISSSTKRLCLVLSLTLLLVSPVLAQGARAAVPGGGAGLIAVGEVRDEPITGSIVVEDPFRGETEDREGSGSGDEDG